MRRLTAGRIFFGRGIDAELRGRLAAVARDVQPNLSVFEQPCESPCPQGLDAWPAPVQSYVQVWTAELGRQFDPERPLPKDLASKFECLVTMDTTDCDATYALFVRRIPVLLLTNSDAKPQIAGLNGHPLLTNGSVAGAQDAMRSFLSFPEAPGRIFVVEGGDGAGKQTQVAKLVGRLNSEGYPVRTFDYPHDAARYGLLIREVLGGHRGNMRAVSPLVFAAVYGVNREDHQPTLAYWLLKGTNVVLDRYMTANFGHQASKYASDDERLSAIKSLATFEQDWLDLPAPFRVSYLNLPPEWALRAMEADQTRKALDEHEKAGLDYKNNVRRAFLWCCANLDGWGEVKCVSEDDTQRLSREAVHDAVWSQLEASFVNKGLGATHLPTS